ncbi:hypothetical protein [Virgibacillus siamensis]|uniref:hypothetical protein n=1 Tax=Virgibacillus siamensis TaxID=480071 RepID=UPI0009875DAB|nr:hypothetical protein [Virgibacillus siamensis]
MKRYWKLIAIVTIIVLTIGTFYVKSALSAGSYTEIVFKKEKGNDEVVEPLILHGNYYANKIGHEFEMTAEKTTFKRERSFLERISNMYRPEMKQLKDEYRSFMRGKKGSVSNYLNSEEVLAYVNIINQSIRETPSEMEFEVDILKKEPDKTVSFSLPVPNRALYANAHVLDVQMIDGDLKVVTSNYPKVSGENLTGEEFHVYSFDIEKQEINGEKEILALGNDDSGNYETISTMGEMNEMSPHPYMVFAMIDQESNTDRGEKAPSKNSSEFIIYNFENGKESKVDVSMDIQFNGPYPYSFDDSNIYAIAGQKNSRIIMYNLESKKVENEVDIPDENSGESLFKTLNGKLYVLLSTMEDASPNIHVFDTKTGDTLYEGEIAVEKPVKGNTFFHFYEMDFRK